MINRFVVMGVSGCGKSHIGAAFAKAIAANFIDGDTLHPDANIAKMRRGEPLNDADRAPWLEKVGLVLGPNTIIACSSLKRSYRDRIRASAGAPVAFLFLQGERPLLLDRMNNRPGHFMPPALLDSQLATLEPPAADELHIIGSINNPPDKIVNLFIEASKELNR
jgi:carbohydrate kinase (thermoresistant glucokinase family)